MPKTIEEINQKITEGSVCVVTADEMVEVVRELGSEKAAQEVDIVTTGTMGAMCSSGAIVNVGHSDPPIKFQRAWMNGVEVCHPGAAVDLYIGAAIMSSTNPFEYGGGHVIEDLIRGREVELSGTAYGTDCYPRTRVETSITKDDLNQFYLLNFRNGYQKYSCATNSRDDTIYTYMGKLLPNFGNATFSGSGCLNPLTNDPRYHTIGIGTRIFLGGTKGYVIGEGTQHNPTSGYGTLMVRGDCKKMSAEFIRGASFTNYGTTLYVGLGIPIPILDEELAKTTGIPDEEIFTEVVDYGIPRAPHIRPVLRDVSYKELKSGSLTIGEREIKVSPLCSLKNARKIAEVLKDWIGEGQFFLSSPVERLPQDSKYKPMRQTREMKFVRELLHPAIPWREDESVQTVAERIIDKSVNHIVVVNPEGYLRGIVTSWDVTKAVAKGKNELNDIIVRDVVCTSPDDPAELASRKMAQHSISALPVIDNQELVLGIVTSEDLSRLLRR
jgi:uncharacterized protein (DUF39 family)/CBS domain-containing protein